MLASELKSGLACIDNYGYKIIYRHTMPDLYICWGNFAKVCTFFDQRSGYDIQRLFWENQSGDYSNKDIRKLTK